MKTRLALFVPFLAVALAACAPPSKYEWGNYERDFIAYYGDPSTADAFAAKLSATIAQGEAKGNVPPGLNAEYGYLMLQAGNAEAAIQAFEKEKAAWPESTTFMDLMIGHARGGKSENQASK